MHEILPDTSSSARASTVRAALIILTSLFFAWGLITSLNDVLIPHLKGIFTLNYVEAMLVQFSFFGAYFVTSLPSGVIVEKVGYRWGIVIGLLTAGCGCLGFYPAAAQQSYLLFLVALFVLASGITLLQVAANPYVVVLGDPETASSRLNLTQAFNSLGTTLGPQLGALFILPATLTATSAVREITTVQMPYVLLAAALLATAIVFAVLKLPAARADESLDVTQAHLPHRKLRQHRHLILGVVAIFVYVGAEVSIGSFFVNFVGQPDIAALPEQTAARYLSFYWGGAMVGRFFGAALMRSVKPGSILAFNAACACVLLLVVMIVAGKTAMWALLAVGLCNSIMFPTIFALAVSDLGKHTSKGSGLLCMAIVGGAIVPLLQGYFADHIGILTAFCVPLVCYAYIVFYGLRGHRKNLTQLVGTIA
jgi:FHS family L-fucose permease-like MFS transporter